MSEIASGYTERANVMKECGGYKPIVQRVYARSVMATSLCVSRKKKVSECEQRVCGWPQGHRRASPNECGGYQPVNLSSECGKGVWAA
jgi:hypothetical protein